MSRIARSHPTTLLLLPFVLVPLLPAQTARVVPAARAAAEGNVNLDLPFWYDAGRVQLVFAGAAVAPTAAVLTGAAFRRGGADTSVYPPRTFNNVVVSMGHAAAGVTPTTMSSTFTVNHGAGVTTVFSGQVSFPAQTGFPSPAPFNIALLFQQPFAYQRSSGDLLLEVEFPGAYTQGRYYTSLDGEMYRGSWGSASPYGTSGPTVTGGGLGLETWANGSPLVPGGTLRTTVRTRGPLNPVLVWLGSSVQHFLGVPLPFDLTAAGAPGNYLLAAMDVVVQTNVQPAGSSWSAHLDWPIPATADMAGAPVFAQAAVHDPQANALGWVFTYGFKVVIAPGAARPVEHNMLYHHMPSFPIGYFPLLTIGQGPAAGGPIVQLQGTFR